MAYYWLQNEDWLTSKAYFFPHRFAAGGDVDPLHKGLVASRHLSKRDDGVALARARLSEIVDGEKSKGILISNESILGEPFERGSDEFYPHAERVAPILAEIFDGYDVDVSFVIRDFTSFIPSYYVQLVRRGDFRSLAGFYGTIDRSTLTWQRPAQALIAAFGRNRVKIYDYDDLRGSSHAMVQQVFSERLGNDLPAVQSENKRRNRSFGGFPLMVNRGSNYLSHKFGVHSSSKHHRLIRRRILAPLSRILPSEKPRLSPAEEEQVRSLFFADRQTLIK